MPRNVFIVPALILACSWGASSLAQQPPAAPAGAGGPSGQNEHTYDIAGTPFECRDFRGRRVVVMQSGGLGDVARAHIIGRIPYIQMDPGRLATLPATLQYFFYGHECAHHVLEHNYRPTPTVEVDADCWSIKNGRDRKLFTRRDVADFKPFFAQSKGSNLGHLPGPERAAHLLKCFDDTQSYARR